MESVPLLGCTGRRRSRATLSMQRAIVTVMHRQGHAGPTATVSGQQCQPYDQPDMAR